MRDLRPPLLYLAQQHRCQRNTRRKRLQAAASLSENTTNTGTPPKAINMENRPISWETRALTYCTQKPLLFNTMVQNDPAGNAGGSNNVLAKRMKPSRSGYPIRPRSMVELFTPFKLDIHFNAFRVTAMITRSFAGSVYTSIVGRFSTKENSCAHCHWGSFR